MRFFSLKNKANCPFTTGTLFPYESQYFNGNANTSFNECYELLSVDPKTFREWLRVGWYPPRSSGVVSRSSYPVPDRGPTRETGSGSWASFACVTILYQ